MEQTGRSQRDSDGRFPGVRYDVESVPRLPTFPARWVLEDPRRRPYFVFWMTADGELSWSLRMARAETADAVRLSTPAGRSFRLAITRSRMPTGTGLAILYLCPGCQRRSRYLYGLTLVAGRLLDNLGWRCQRCAGLRWASQGRYQSVFHRLLLAAVAAEYGLARYREPLPRRPWDPRAVSDPTMVVGIATDRAGPTNAPTASVS
jgi:hypothetical protein